MGDLACQQIPDSQTLQAEIADQLPPHQEVFAAEVACGKSFRVAARLAGLNEDTGWKLMQIPSVRARVAELLKDGDIRDKAAIDARWTQIGNRVAESDLNEEDRANVDLHMRFLMNYAKYRGWIKERKEVRQVNINLSQAEAKAMLEQQLQAIPAAARRQIEASIADAKAAVMPGPARDPKARK